MPWWTESLGRVELKIPTAVIRSVCNPGPNDAAVADATQHPQIRGQLARLDAGRVRDALREYGAWDLDELQDPVANLRRILWCACWDLYEEMP